MSGIACNTRVHSRQVKNRDHIYRMLSKT
jgi:hypothetical protein